MISATYKHIPMSLYAYTMRIFSTDCDASIASVFCWNLCPVRLAVVDQLNTAPVAFVAAAVVVGSFASERAALPYIAVVDSLVEGKHMTVEEDSRDTADKLAEQVPLPMDSELQTW